MAAKDGSQWKVKREGGTEGLVLGEPIAWTMIASAAIAILCADDDTGSQHPATER
jgi:hypothetical protein